jgi:hypothetical protein
MILNTGTRRQALTVLYLLMRDVGVPDAHHLTEMASRQIDFYTKGIEPNPLQHLFDAWYTPADEPAWWVYDEPVYLVEAFACWWVYSRKYVNELARSTHFDRVRSIADLGCGIGFSTAQLAAHFPRATVHSTQLDSWQARIAERLGQGQFTIHTEPVEREPVEMVFASEYFEHFPAPGDHLTEILNVWTPTHVVHASTFRNPSIGHFGEYRFGDDVLDGTATGRRFNQLLRDRGYGKVDTGWWNNRPTYYRLA